MEGCTNIAHRKGYQPQGVCFREARPEKPEREEHGPKWLPNDAHSENTYASVLLPCHL